MSLEQSATPLRAIIARFTIPMSRNVVRNLLRDLPFEYAAFLTGLENPDPYEELPVEKQDWFFSGDLRSADYDVSWSELAPLDEELLLSMRDTEALFMDAVSRLEWKKHVPYANRKRLYLRHVQFWNDYLTRHKINLFVSAWVPHELADIILYRLCRLKGIPTLYYQPSLVSDISLTEHSWEEPAPRVGERLRTLQKEYEGVTDPMEISLCAPLEQRYRTLAKLDAEIPKIETFKRPSEIDILRSFFWEKPLAFLRNGLTYCTPDGLMRARETFRRWRSISDRNHFYDTHAVDPDLTKRFVYLPLHFQPEASTTPLAGCFTDQILIARLLNAHLPDDVLIYVKEHPRESAWVKRSVRDYEEFLALDKVRLVARKVDTFALREECVTVATGSGSASFEAPFREKPAIIFGNRFSCHMPGVYRVHTEEDCKRAVREIFDEGKKPSLRDVRLFLKAVEEAGVHGSLHPWHLKATELTDEEHTKANSEALTREIHALQSEIDSVSSSYA